MICTCDACHSTFNSTNASRSKYDIPRRCPDCGKMVIHTASGSVPAVRAATEDEIKEYRNYQREMITKMAERIYKG